MQCGEGGVVVTDDEGFALRMAMLRNHGECVASSLELDTYANTFGLNYRMTEMEAAVALVQLKKLDALNAKRLELADEISSNLVNLDGFRSYICLSTHVYYFYPIKFDASEVGLSRDLFVSITSGGFTTRSGYLKPLYLEPQYINKIVLVKMVSFYCKLKKRRNKIPRGLCPIVERLDASELITNIIYPPLSKTDMLNFVEACEKIINNRDLLKKAFSEG